MFSYINVSGAEARSFLQGQLTQDVERLRDSATLPAACCDPKGRVIATLRLLDGGALGVSGDSDEAGSIAMLVPESQAPGLTARLQMYRLRAKVDIEPDDGALGAWAVAGTSELEALAAVGLLPERARNACRRAHGLIAVDIGAPAGRTRCIEIYGSRAALDSACPALRTLSEAGWRRALIEAGIPLIEPASAGRYTPHMLNLDCLGAVSFSKGCYTGQEVVARTQHLGRSKRRLAHFRSEDGGGVAVGEKCRLGDREVGTVVNVAGAHLLAVLPVALHGRTIEAGGRAAAAVDLPYGLPET